MTRCDAIVANTERLLAELALLVPPMDPPPGFKDRLMRRAAAELAAEQHQRTTRDARRRWRALFHYIILRPRQIRAGMYRRRLSTLLAAIVAAGVLAAGVFGYQRQTVATYLLVGGTPGRALLVQRRSGQADLQLSGLPEPQPGLVHEAWVVPPNGNAESAGTAATGTASIAIAEIPPGTTVAITLERGRSNTPTSSPLKSAVVR